jgi:hypothetical protein
MLLKPDLLLQEQPSRRGLLRTLIAAPVAAMATHKLILPAQADVAPAEREALLDAYSCWIDNERRWLAWERAAGDRRKFSMFLDTVSYTGHGAGRFHDPDTPAPSTRAAHVLAAVGCQWREGRQ